MRLEEKLAGVGWPEIEAALNDPDLRMVDVSRELYDEIVRDLPRRDRAMFGRLPREVPGCVMMFHYDRAKGNIRVLGMDEAGSEWAMRMVSGVADEDATGGA